MPGMNWAMPCAPAPLVANGLKPDSAYSCAASRFIGTFQRSAALAIGSWKRGGTKLGRPCLIRPWSPPGGSQAPFSYCAGCSRSRGFVPKP